jgi:hypothetical protein
MMLDNYMNQKTKYVNQGLINDLSNTSLNEYVIHGNEDDITTLVDKDFAKYCSSYRFTKDINRKYDNVFNVRTIFKTVDAFKNINVQYAESIVDSSFNDDDVSEHTELDIIQDDSDSDNFDNDDTSDNMSENYDDDELNEELDDYERQGYHGHHADSDLDDIDDDDDGL